ncbi:MAG: hypothetical protein Q8Q89_05020 [bacterium]|nr:hypothetical protein [bacterium]
MSEFWGNLMVAIVLIFFIKPILRIADAVSDIANHLCEVDYDDDDPDKEPVLDGNLIDIRSDTHLKKVEKGKVLPFKKTG